MLRLSTLFLLLSLLSACQESAPAYRLLERGEMVGLPSASGSNWLGERLYVVGDDSPYLFELQRNGQAAIAALLVDSAEAPAQKWPKGQKMDFEAVASGPYLDQEALWIFGSGSKSPQRDVLIVYCPDCPQTLYRYSLLHFYGQLRQSAALDGEELNIEGAAWIGDEMILLNRQGNRLLRWSRADFLSLLDPAQPFVEPQVSVLRLPAIDQLEATLSGLCYDAAQDRVIFTASVEDNRDPVADGAILGSVLGQFPWSDLAAEWRPQAWVLRDSADAPLTVKVESVALLAWEGTAAPELILVTDSDGGASEFLRVSIKN